MTEKLAYIKSTDILTDSRQIIESARRVAYRAADVVLVQRNWLLGKRIAEEQLGNQTREELYGKSLIQNLATQLTAEYGSGFDFSYNKCSLFFMFSFVVSPPHKPYNLFLQATRQLVLA